MSKNGSEDRHIYFYCMKCGTQLARMLEEFLEEYPDPHKAVRTECPECDYVWITIAASFTNIGGE